MWGFSGGKKKEEEEGKKQVVAKPMSAVNVVARVNQLKERKQKMDAMLDEMDMESGTGKKKTAKPGK